MTEFDKLLDELTIKIDVGHQIWEEKLKLWVRPKPKYLSDSLWQRLVSLVLIQSVEKGEFRDNDNL